MKKHLLAAVASVVLMTPALAMAAGKNLLSVHILNQQTGKPTAGVEVVLEQKKADGWEKLNSGTTDQDGRIKALWPEKAPAAGDYRVIFKTGAYFKSQQQDTFFPEIPVEFHISKTDEHYHVPLLLSQFGYSTYRGS